VPTDELRPLLAREGIFNVRDLGGIPSVDGRVVAHGRLVRADALHRARGTAARLREHGVVRVLDLRDQRERDEEGVLEADGIEVLHLPVLDPTFEWFDDEHDDPSTLLALRYRSILQVVQRDGGALLTGKVGHCGPQIGVFFCRLDRDLRARSGQAERDPGRDRRPTPCRQREVDGHPAGPRPRVVV